MKLFKRVILKKESSVATKLREYRLKYKISLRELAKKAKISPSTLSDIETQKANTTLKTSINITKSLEELIAKQQGK